MSKPRGFSLAELLVALTVLALLTTLIFGALIMGARVIHEASLRQSAETELRAIQLRMEKDVELTNFWLSQVASRSGTGYSRDGLALVALSDWDSPANFDSTNLAPAWDRFVVWYATQTDPGFLVRQEIRPNPAPVPYIQAPYVGLGANLNDLDPTSNDDVVSTRYLSRNLLDFEVIPRFQNGTFRVRLHLRRQGGKRALSRQSLVDSLDLLMTFVPKNTWPAI